MTDDTSPDDDRARRFVDHLPMADVEAAWLPVLGASAMPSFIAGVRRQSVRRLGQLLAAPLSRVGSIVRRDWRGRVEPAMARWSLAHAECNEGLGRYHARTGDTSGEGMLPDEALAMDSARERAAALAWDTCEAGNLHPPLLCATMRAPDGAFAALGADLLHHVRRRYAAETERPVRVRMRGLAQAVLRAGTVAVRRDDARAVAEMLVNDRAPRPTAPVA